MIVIWLIRHWNRISILSIMSQRGRDRLSEESDAFDLNLHSFGQSEHQIASTHVQL